MIEWITAPRDQNDEACVRALEARDARFDGIFFVGITSTRIYCRPICPARVSRPSNRRFFPSAATAERAGFRPCRRCRPELAPGSRALVDAVSRLARAAARRIEAGALNGRPVGQLARELCVSERHLRRALERELGVTPLELAQTHRLLLAKQLLTDTTLSVARVAYASGFQSLRRFNAVFRERYGMTPRSLRAKPQRRPGDASNGASAEARGFATDGVGLTLSYRPPLAWLLLLRLMQRDALQGVVLVEGRSYARTVQIDGCRGVVVARPAAGGASASQGTSCLRVDISLSLVPVLMPLLARLRQLFDLNAEPAAIDGCLHDAGLGALVELRPGVRLPGAMDGFEAGLVALLRRGATDEATSSALGRRIVVQLGEPIDTGDPRLDRLSPGADRIADAGAARLGRLGVPAGTAQTLNAFARAVADGAVRLDAGADIAAARASLEAVPGIDERLSTRILAAALSWPDAFTPSDPALQRAADVHCTDRLQEMAEAWRPWRAYATVHLRLHDEGARG
jgi:AraC family transcriptional regulator, regulatory protein of adaptative response / DNA-3-methyladenine glycosylase II